VACSCGNNSCSCQAPVTLHLQDEHGNLHPFYLADKLQIADREYAFAVSLENANQYALLRVEVDETGETRYHNIVDEAEWAEIERFVSEMN
jgi:hypothetical protein